MSYTDAISRDNAAATINEEVASEIQTGIEQTSVAFSLMRQARMSKKQQRLPVVSAFPQAYFVNGDTGLKQTTQMAWANKYLNAEEVAVIVPIPDAVIDDSDFDLWSEIKPKIIEAFALLIDKAIIFGVNKPILWGPAIVPAAIAAGNVLHRGTVSGQDVAGDISDIMSMVEADGFDVNGHVARKSIRGALRNLRDDNGQPIFTTSIRDGEGQMLWGEPLRYVAADGWVNADADLVTGDWKQAIVATRQDFTYKMLDEATLFDNAGNVVFNLAQQDMRALRVVGRFAYEQANVLNRDNSNAGTRNPFAVLQPV